MRDIILLVVALVVCLIVVAATAGAQPLALVDLPPGSVGRHLATERAAPGGIATTTWEGFLAAVGGMPEPARGAWLRAPTEMVPQLLPQAWEQARLERKVAAQRAEHTRLVRNIEATITRIEARQERMR